MSVFGLTEDQLAIRNAVRTFARADLAPGYLERATSTEFPWEVHRQVAGLGVLGMLAGPDHNPLEHDDYVAAGLAIEELAYADFNVANAVIPVMLMSSLIAAHASPAIRDRWLPPLIAGETYIAFGLTEPHSGSDATALRTTAVADGDGYLLTGEKTSVTMLGHAEAMIVTAQTVRDGENRGVSTFLVDLSADGLAKSDIPDTGWKPMGRGVLHLDGVRVPADALIGAEGSAFRSVLGGFDFTRPLLALTGIGCAQSCLDLTADYVRDRVAFGEPLSRFEGVSFPLAEHSTTLEAARLLCYSALWRRNEGLRHTAEAAMSKWYGPLSASAAVKDCLLLHGNYGYATEYGLEQRLRDVMAVEIADGTAQIQKIIIARERYGRDFVPYSKA
ncbi:acyl-CoA dehydrogenase family protein [Kribbia dieselivorans]|uniref:acyl-CoA dehydrogenase family protein n=1 Tax=Kribbia dieselivorans TaxID=331526 RepID=UPI000839309E|nr:acyl-CoA dehydrogenase family protein [Kribbia dieselivorans]